jgi:hypothetical protein
MFLRGISLQLIYWDILLRHTALDSLQGIFDLEDVAVWTEDWLG